jgi:pyruvate carboxylase
MNREGRILNHDYVISTVSGRVEEVVIEVHSRIYEWEKLFTVRTNNGNLETVSVGLSGEVVSIEVKPGDSIIPGMVLAFIKDDLFPMGSD